MLSTDKLGFRYGSQWALRHVSAELRRGITGLLGANGAGKTTFMRLALGLLPPAEGEVSLFGANPMRRAELRLRVGYLPQTFAVPQGMRVAAYLESLTLLAGRSPKEAREGTLEALATVGLTEQAKSRLDTLSGGMLRRVGVAQALAHRPELLIVDEPAAGLDPEERARLYRGLRSAAEARPVLVSSHHVDELEREADFVWFLRRGALTWTGSVEEALTSLRGKVREGILPQGERPEGAVVSERRTAEGTFWRIVGSEPKLQTAEPTLLDAYIAYASPAGEE